MSTLCASTDLVPEHRSVDTAVRRSVIAGALMVVTLFGAACSTSTPTNEVAGGASPTTAAAPSATRADTSSTAEKSGSTGSTSRGASSSNGTIKAEGPCALLNKDEVESATNEEIDNASVVRGGCRYEKRVSPVVDVEIETSSESSFKSSESLYGDAAAKADVAGIGEQSYVDGLSDKVVFLKDGKMYTVWIQSIDDKSRRRSVAIELAKKVDSRT